MKHRIQHIVLGILLVISFIGCVHAESFAAQSTYKDYYPNEKKCTWYCNNYGDSSTCYQICI